jgi:hypothetical protein
MGAIVHLLSVFFQPGPPTFAAIGFEHFLGKSFRIGERKNRRFSDIAVWGSSRRGSTGGGEGVVVALMPPHRCSDVVDDDHHNDYDVRSNERILEDKNDVNCRDESSSSSLPQQEGEDISRRSRRRRRYDAAASMPLLRPHRRPCCLGDSIPTRLCLKTNDFFSPRFENTFQKKFKPESLRRWVAPVEKNG